MSLGIFLDKEHLPTSEEIQAALGPAWIAWESLNQYLSEHYPSHQSDLTFGGKKYGWNVGYRRSGKTLVSLFPQQGGFVAQVVLGKDAAEKALALDLSPGVRKAVEETPQLHDGRWLFLRVENETEAADIRRLLGVKAKPK
jgi:hypothetical protein